MKKRERTRGYFNEKVETASPSERRRYLNQKLRKIVRHAYENAPAIRKKLDLAKVAPKDLKTLADLERIPVTAKSELVAMQKKKPPFGGFNGVPPEEMRRIFASPGPIYEPGEMVYDDTRWAQALYAGGFRPKDLAQVTFGFHLTPFAFMLDESLKMLGCRVIPAGFGNTEVQVQLLKDLKVTGFLGTPSFLNTLLEKALELNYNPKRDFALEAAFVAAEMLPESLREKLETSFGLMVRQSYGTADIGCLGYECVEKSGMHIPDDCIVEIVDPATGKQLGPGETGEVVGTCFNRVYPLIRFGTGDLSYYTEEPCPCGRTTGRLVKILGRLDQLTKVKGMFIHPNLVEEVARRFPEICRCRLVVTREAHQDRMVFEGELACPVSDPQILLDRIRGALQEILRLRGEVAILSPGTLPKEGKIIEDRRSWE